MGRTTHSLPEVTVALQGTLDTFALPDVLRLLAATKKTGCLRITADRGTGSVWVSSGEVSAVDAVHAPHATDPVDALFELLRFDEGAFTFDAEATHDHPGRSTDVELLLEQSEALLAEWRTIESVIPSLDAWVTLRRHLPQPEVTLDQDSWTTIVAVGAGATLRRLGDDLALAELPVSRAVKGLLEGGFVDIADAAPPTGPVSLFNGGSAAPERPLVAEATEPPKVAEVPEAPQADEHPAPIASGPRARRASKALADGPAQPETFVPLDLPGHAVTASYDRVDDYPATDRATDRPAGADDLAAAFPGLANRATPHPATGLSPDDEEEVAKQLATLSPRAASAIRAAAEATTDEEREAALDAAEGDQPLNRGLLLKFLSSVKS